MGHPPNSGLEITKQFFVYQNSAESVDLQDAYLHISIFPLHKWFLHFAMVDQYFQYITPSFGLSSAPFSNQKSACTA